LDKEILLGIRPEHLQVYQKQSGQDFSSPQDIQVDVVEPVGNEVFLYFTEADTQYCMRMLPEKMYKPGDKIQIAFNLGKVYFFDSQTDERLF
jgi:multiple sugar transport system ATP-binding protein